MKTKAINYIFYSKIKSASKARELMLGTFKQNKLGLRPKFSIDADLFLREINHKILPKNLVIKVKGDIDRFVRIAGKQNSEIKAGNFENALDVFGALKLSAKKIKYTLNSWGKAQVNAKTIEGNAFIRDKSSLEVGTQTGALFVFGKTKTIADKLLAGIQANGKAKVLANTVKGDIIANENSHTLLLGHLGGKVNLSQGAKVEIITAKPSKWDNTAIF